MSDLTISGIEWEPGALNPYRAFVEAVPSDNMAGALLVYQGKFDLRDVVAVAHIARANNLLGDNARGGPCGSPGGGGAHSH